MTGHDYEYLVARYLRNNGYTNVKVTKGSGDYGVDVVAHKRGKKYAVQCKHYTGPVGLSAVQEAVAGKAMYKCDSAMVVTNSTFTNAARDLAKANNVVLIEKVNTAGGSCLRYLVAGLLIFGYGLVAVAIVCSTIENSQGTPTGTAIRNLFLALAAVSFPLWIRPAVKGLKKMIKNLFCKIKAQKGSAVVEPPKPVQPKPEPPTAKPENEYPEGFKRYLERHSAPVVQEKPVRAEVSVLVGLKQLKAEQEDMYAVLYEVVKLAIEKGGGISVSMIQRHLKWGYARAAKLLDEMETLGFVSPFSGSKPRQVLVSEQEVINLIAAVENET